LDHIQQLGFAKAQFPHQAVNDFRLPGGNAGPKNALCQKLPVTRRGAPRRSLEPRQVEKAILSHTDKRLDTETPPSVIVVIVAFPNIAATAALPGMPAIVLDSLGVAALEFHADEHRHTVIQDRVDSNRNLSDKVDPYEKSRHQPSRILLNRDDGGRVAAVLDLETVLVQRTVCGHPTVGEECIDEDAFSLARRGFVADEERGVSGIAYM
jgi:hypothetical protein